MRITSLAVLALLGCGAAWAGSRSETTTYVDGDLAGIKPDTGATLSLADDTGITLRTGLTTVSVPYSGVSHAELGAVKESAHDVPLYKVWALHKRFAHKAETQLLIVNFKNEAGEEKSMTLELAKDSADGVLATIQDHAGNSVDTASATPAPEHKTRSHRSKTEAASAKPAPADNDAWWGDRYWKTKNNQDKWSKPAGTNAPDQQ